MLRAKLGLVMVISGLLALPAVACSASPDIVPTPEPTPGHPANVALEEPVLAGSLKRDCQLTPGRGNFDGAGLSIGEAAVNFTLRDVYGAEFGLSRLLADKPVVMVLGSFT